MNSKKYLLAISALFFLLVSIGSFSSCKKGDTGPAGPQGTPGDSGINGSANLITNTYTVTTSIAGTDTVSPWISTNTPTYHWAANFIDSSISISTLDAVEVYWSTSYTADWNALPVTSLINQGDEMSYRYNEDSVSFTYYTGGASYSKYPGYPATSPQFTTLFFKVVVIPPGLQLNYPGTDWKNASEVASLPPIRAALKRQ